MKSESTLCANARRPHWTCSSSSSWQQLRRRLARCAQHCSTTSLFQIKLAGFAEQSSARALIANCSLARRTVRLIVEQANEQFAATSYSVFNVHFNAFYFSLPQTFAAELWQRNSKQSSSSSKASSRRTLRTNTT